MIKVYPRGAWGAEYSDGDGPAALPATAVYLHHSVTAAPMTTASLDTDAAAVRLLEQIGQARFRAGISYTFVVCPSGRVFQGHSVTRRGTHTRGLNSSARAIVLVGDYSKVAPGPLMVDAVAQLLRLGHRNGWWVASRLAGGHRNAPGAQTECPGDGAWATIPAINRAADDSAELGAPAVAPRPAPSSVLRLGAHGPEVESLQRWLNRHDWTPDLPLLFPDGVFGDRTMGVVALAQRQCCVTVDGVVGPLTRAAFEASGWRP